MRFGNLIRFIAVLGAVIGVGSAPRIREKSGSDSNLDQEFEDALRDLEINFNLDKTTKKSGKIKEIISTTERNIRQDIRSSVYDRQAPRDVILKCIEEIDIEVLDLRYSKKTIEQIRKSRGVAYGSGMRGEYIPDFKKLIILNEFDGKHSIGLIIHECTHLHEHANKIEYDEKKLLTCVSNLRELGIEAIQCLDDVKKDGCDPIKEIAQSYKDRIFITKGDGIITENGQHDSTKPITMSVEQLSGYHLKKRDPVLSFTPGSGNHVAVELEGVKNKKSNRIKSVSGEEKLLFQMEEHLRNIPTFDEISSAYPSPKFNHSEQLKEVHAALVQRVPFPLIDEFCEDLEIRPASVTKNREPKTREPMSALKKASKEKTSKGRDDL